MNEKNNGRSNQVPYCLHIYTLGPFRVASSEQELLENDWRWHQAKLLLKAFLAQEKKAVPKDILMECLWPGKNPRRSEQNFRTTLHRLRRSLQTLSGKDFSAFRVIRGIVSLDPRCWVDLRAFRESVEKGKQCEFRGSKREAVKHYTRAATLYQGDFLEVDLYVDWAAHTRERLKEQYLELLLKIADLRAAQGDLTGAVAACSKILDKDNSYEEAYYRLIMYYNEGRQPCLALRAYQQYRQALNGESALEPHQRMKELCDRITSPVAYEARHASTGAAKPPVQGILKQISRTADACWAVDQKQRLILWNHAAERLFGRKSADVLGKYCYSVIADAGKKNSLVSNPRCHVFTAARESQPVNSYDLLIRQEAGNTLWINISIIPLYAGDGELAALVHLARPTTTRRRGPGSKVQV